MFHSLGRHPDAAIVTIGRGEQAQYEAGLSALRRGDAAAARIAFERLIGGGSGDSRARLLFAQACRLGGDAAGAATALDQLLADEPRNIQALLMRGDCHRLAGDLRAATSFYQAALAAGRDAGALPPALAAQLDRARGLVRDAGNAYQQHLLAELRARGADAGHCGPRFARALDILFGRSPADVRLQRPSSFYFPDLPQRKYYEREEFAWAAELEAATGDIRDEVLALLRDGDGFRPYVEQEQNRPFRDFHGMLGDPSWTAFHLWQDGRLVEENAARCPRTVAALERVPLARMGARTPSVHFSLLQPNAHIPPHHGMLNTRLICHLPLIVPPGCWLRVADETRHWEEGRLMVFDDSIEHEARNPSGQLRVILLFDIWRPELDEAERRAVTAIFETIDAFRGGAAG